MSRTRDIIKEIAEVRQRRQHGYAMAELPLRLLSLERAFKEHDQSNVELTRYFPVAVIACIESYFRMAIKELVDAGDPYLSNAERAASSIRLDYTLVKAIHGKKITVGELVGHNVALSHLDHIELAMSALLGRSFLGSMRTVTDRWKTEVCGQPLKPIIAEPDKVFANVARTFELRHIICHEFASAHEADYQEVAKCFESSVAFVRAADEIVSNALYPNAPLTQSEMNDAAKASLIEARSILDEAVAKLQSRLSSEELDAFNNSQLSWERYCTAWSEFDAMKVEGGTMWPALRANSEHVLVRNRIDEVRDYQGMEDSLHGET